MLEDEMKEKQRTIVDIVRRIDLHDDEINNQGNIRLKQRTQQRNTSSLRVTKSAFDDDGRYELTSLGNQFVHYAMTEVRIKLDYQPDEAPDDEPNGS